MHDEAATHYIDMIDQTTLGHRVIKQQFNKTPRAGWQIDPFGHSAVQSYLLGAEVMLTQFADCPETLIVFQNFIANISSWNIALNLLFVFVITIAWI
jgi:hypothetical protein